MKIFGKSLCSSENPTEKKRSTTSKLTIVMMGILFIACEAYGGVTVKDLEGNTVG